MKTFMTICALAAGLALAGCSSSAPAGHSTATGRVSATTTASSTAVPPPASSSPPPNVARTTVFQVPFTATFPTGWNYEEIDKGAFSVWPGAEETAAPVDITLDLALLHLAPRAAIDRIHAQAAKGASAVRTGRFDGRPAFYFDFDPGRTYNLKDSGFHGFATDHLRIETVGIRGRTITVLIITGKSHADLLAQLPLAATAIDRIRFA